MINSVKATHLVQKSNCDEYDPINYYLGKFGDEMKNNIGTNWASARSIRELIAMAKGIRSRAGYDYMKMSTKGKNEFKNNTENLPLFTEIENGKTPLIITTPYPSKRNRQIDVSVKIDNEDNQVLILEQENETCIFIEKCLRNERYEEAQKRIEELKKSSDIHILQKAKEYQERIDKANKTKYENEFN